MKPIFFAWTRSFWLTVIGIAVLIFGQSTEILQSFGALLAVALPWTGNEIGDALVKVAPVILWAAALQQRSGVTRPYTMDPRALD